MAYKGLEFGHKARCVDMALAVAYALVRVFESPVNFNYSLHPIGFEHMHRARPHIACHLFFFHFGICFLETTDRRAESWHGNVDICGTVLSGIITFVCYTCYLCLHLAMFCSS